MRFCLLSLVLAGCATAGGPAVTQARAARDAAGRFLAVTMEQDEAAQSQLRAEAINPSTNLRAIASQTKLDYARRLVLLRDAELKVAIDRERGRDSERLSRDQRRVEALRADTERLRFAWEMQRRSADYARAAMPDRAPSTLQPIRPPPTGANEGPSAGFQDLPQPFPPP